MRPAAWPWWRWWPWLLAYTFVPRWVPARWRRPAIGYALAALLQVVTAAISWLCMRASPTFSYPGLLEILVVALVALSWGAGPSLLATLVSLVLLETVVVPFHVGAGQTAIGEGLEALLFLAAGITISLVASRTEGARRHAEVGQAEAQARELALRLSQQRMDEFMGIAAHELKTPLTGLQGNLQLMARRLSDPRLEQAGADDLARVVARVRSLVARAQDSLHRIGRLIDDLLDDARIHQGRLEFRLERCDLAAIVRAAVEDQREIAGPRAIRLELPEVQPVLVIADASRIEQIVTNYLSNALKYSPEDRPVAVRLQVEGALARVRVCDEGIGVPLAEQGHIWERFYRVEGVTIQSGSGIGMGIGLHISKTIVEGHGGQVGVESEVGQGSTFWFTLPLAAAAS